DGIILRVAVAAKNLHRFISNVIERLAPDNFYDRTLDGIVLNSFQHLFGIVAIDRRERVLDHADCAISHAVGHVSANSHFRDLVLDQAKRGYRNPELITLLGVVCSNRRESLRCGNSTHPKFQPSDVQNIESDLMTLPDLAKHVLDRHLRLLEVHCASRRALKSHLMLFLCSRYSRGIALDDERGKLLAGDLCKHREHARESGICKPHLLT